MADWIAAIAAVVSLLGAGFAWWHSNLSTRAKSEAESAREAAQAYLSTVRALAASTDEQAGEISRVRATLEGAPLEVSQESKSRWVVANRRSVPVVVVEVVNRDDFMRLTFNTPVTLPPFGSSTITAMGSYGSPVPEDLVLLLEGEAEPLRLRLPKTM